MLERFGRARICKRSRIPGIDSASLCNLHGARAGTSNRVVVPAHQAGNRFLGSLKGLQMRALILVYCTSTCGCRSHLPTELDCTPLNIKQRTNQFRTRNFLSSNASCLHLYLPSAYTVIMTTSLSALVSLFSLWDR